MKIDAQNTMKYPEPDHPRHTINIWRRVAWAGQCIATAVGNRAFAFLPCSTLREDGKFAT
jgi:hypothetical protein